MSETIIFTGAYVRYLDLRIDPKGENAHVRIHMTANYTQEVRDCMKWPEIPDKIQSANLNGELLASSMILTPEAPELLKYEAGIDVDSIKDFRSVMATAGESNKRELRFVVRSSKADVESIVGTYIRRIGKTPGSLKASYAKQLALGEGERAEPAEKNTVVIKKSGR